ncbi:hypothetical protein MMA231_03260 [Asticcacaulis sp. MM231]
MWTLAFERADFKRIGHCLFGVTSRRSNIGISPAIREQPPAFFRMHFCRYTNHAFANDIMSAKEPNAVKFIGAIAMELFFHIATFRASIDIR